ncbi:hypothetical protein [Latilactobacillus sakei]|uniref:hypothetical protein n=1 Tax=Latilactobacillus sakei TaxID=1599 RepID=UPI001BD3E558|nr:hypothetical protein [Latilactobacillus sakei]QVQ48609.1 hypothetical protein KIK01_08355 [Latilactobacillus sakei subsp. sakei]
MNRFMLTMMQSDANHAGSKAVRDISEILSKMDFLNIYIDGQQSRLEREIFTKSNLSRKLQDLPRESYFLVQYPFYLGTRVTAQVIDEITSKFDNTIVLIHDLPTLRENASKKLVKREISNLNKFKFVVTHNTRMSGWLKDNGCTSKILELGLFDYMTNSSLNVKKNNNYKRIFFAGNLGKSKFIYNKAVNNNYYLYGINRIDGQGDFNYLGVRSPEKLLIDLACENGFGLVWDGDSVNESDAYTRYNNPHKASLYLASGMPLIVWNKSALSELVDRTKIGISVGSIEEANKVISNITQLEYDNYKANVNKFQNRVTNGGFTESVILKILD